MAQPAREVQEGEEFVALWVLGTAALAVAFLHRHPRVYLVLYFCAPSTVPPFPVTCSPQPKDTNSLFQ